LQRYSDKLIVKLLNSLLGTGHAWQWFDFVAPDNFKFNIDSMA